METLQKSEQIKEGHQKLSFPGLPSLLHSSCLYSVRRRLWHDTDFWRPKLLIKLFLGEMNGSLGRGELGGLNRIIKLYQLCDAPPSVARWKAAHFHAPSKPLTRHEKIWHQFWQKTQGRNEWCHCGRQTSIMLNTSEKQCIFCLRFRGDKQHLWLA